MSELRECPGWRPISEAPRDGTTFLAWSLNWGNEAVMARWNGEEFEDCVPSYGTGCFAPTHFMPLPEPPGATNDAR